MDNALFMKQLILHEGLKLSIYTDTVGKVTVGVGHNLTDRGITKAQALMFLRDDIAVVEADLDQALPWWRDLSEVRQRVIADMCFNLGIARLGKFKATLAAMREGNYREAAVGMLSSLWAHQVGRRADRLAEMMKTGLDTGA